MNFKEQVERDICGVFLNIEEFAEMHRVEGKQIPVVIDSDQRSDYKEGEILGIVKADLLLIGKESDLPKELNPSRMINLDGRELLIVDSARAMGMVEVALRQTRTG